MEGLAARPRAKPRSALRTIRRNTRIPLARATLIQGDFRTHRLRDPASAIVRIIDVRAVEKRSKSEVVRFQARAHRRPLQPRIRMRGRAAANDVEHRCMNRQAQRIARGNGELRRRDEDRDKECSVDDVAHAPLHFWNPVSGGGSIRSREKETCRVCFLPSRAAAGSCERADCTSFRVQLISGGCPGADPANTRAVLAGLNQKRHFACEAIRRCANRTRHRELWQRVRETNVITFSRRFRCLSARTVAIVRFVFRATANCRGL
jgi:hypothetical protein